MPAPCAKIVCDASEHVGGKPHRNSIVAEPQRVATDQVLEKDAEPEAIEIPESDVALESVAPDVERAAVSLIQRRSASLQLEHLRVRTSRARRSDRRAADDALAANATIRLARDRPSAVTLIA